MRGIEKMHGYAIQMPDGTIYKDCEHHFICAPTPHEAWMAFVGPNREYMIHDLYEQGHVPIEIVVAKLAEKAG